MVNDRALKRLAEGLTEEQIDEPLAPEVQRDLIKVAADYYHWGNIDARRIMSDRQMARVRREFPKLATDLAVSDKNKDAGS